MTERSRKACGIATLRAQPKKKSEAVVRSNIMSAKLPIIKEPHPQLLASEEGRQSIALAGWGSSGLRNQADMILLPPAPPASLAPFPLKIRD